MKRISYVLLALTAVFCSVAAGIMTYQSAMASDVKAQLKAEIMDRLAQETWYLPLSEEYSGIQSLDDAGEIYGAFAGDREVLINKRGKITAKIPASMTVFDMSLGWVQDYMDTGVVGDGLLIYQDRESKKLGYIDLEGNVVIKARYDSATAFDKGYAVKEEDTEGGRTDVQAPIDKSGKVLYDAVNTDPGQDFYTGVRPIEGKYFLMTSRTTSEQRLFDAEKGAFIREWKKDEAWNWITGLGEGRYGGYRGSDNSILLMDESFEPLSETQSFTWMDRFSEGLCYAVWEEKGGKVSGYVDADGRIKLRTKENLYGGRFTEGKAFLWEKDSIRVIDKDGRKLFEIKLSKPQEGHPTTDYSSNEPVPSEFLECRYRDGFAVCCDGKYFGIIDEQGRWIIEPVFDWISFSGADAAVVSIDGKEGILKVGGNRE